VALVLSEDCPVATALAQALTEGGVRVQRLDKHSGVLDAEQALDRLAERAEGPPHRFVVGLGPMSLPALKLAGQRQLSGLVLISPLPLHPGEARRVPAPTLLISGERAYDESSADQVPLWQLRFASLDQAWCELPASELHSLVEATVLWVRARSAE
jgi:hypothetical protein